MPQAVPPTSASPTWVGTEVAVIGMAGRFPDAPDVDAFWANLRAGREAVRPFSPEALRSRGVPEDVLGDPDYVASGAVLDGVDRFAADFFGISPRDAAIMDPQHRVFLECAWEALEHAGYDPGRYGGAIGVFAGSGMHAYLLYHLARNPRLMASVGEFLIRHTGNDKDFLATRASYELGLTGPSVNVQTACSTSLVAVHLAVQSLLSGESDVALAGGVTINLRQEEGYRYQPGEILSPDGHCRAFDAEAAGTHFGSGCGLVVLKRLERALADGDTVHALLLGSAVNNDGRQKVGYMAPSVDGQAAVVAEALSVSGVAAESVSYVEAHGTGTPIGDPIEVAALTQAYRLETDRRGFCGLGSVKTNIGHLDTAAGVAGLIKTVQALRNRELPPTLHFREANPKLELAESPFYVVDRSSPWDVPEGQPRRAGVSALGVGGTNAHVVLEEAPALAPSGPSRPYQLLSLSAKTETAVTQAAARLARHLEALPETALADAAYTLHVGRRAFPLRRSVVAADAAEAVRALAASAGRQREAPTGASAAFLFAGGGAQHVAMGRGLYEAEPVYRREVDRGLALLLARTGLDLRPILFPSEGAERAAEALTRPLYALPALLLTQHALARQLMAWGVSPTALIGHSLGEYTAATVAGVWDLGDALAIVAERGRLFETLPPGAMLSVGAALDAVAASLPEGVSVAAVNAPDLSVLAGPEAAVAGLEAELVSRGIDARRLKIDVAAHSALVEPVVEPFRRFVAGVPARPPQIPFASNLTGTWITAAEATDPDYWSRHLRETVRFADGVRTLLKDPSRVLLEVGPGRTLATLALMHPDRKREHPVLTTMRHPQERVDDQRVLLESVGALWEAGVDVDWEAFYGGQRRRRVPLPTYPFERERYWIEPEQRDGRPEGAVPQEESAPGSALKASPEGRLLRRDAIDDWFERVVWERVEEAPPLQRPAGEWLVVFPEVNWAPELVAALEARGASVTVVQPGTSFAHDGAARYRLRLGSSEDFEALASALEAEGRLPRRVVYLWGLARCEGATGPLRGTDARAAAEPFFGLLHLMRALGEDPERRFALDVVTAGAHAIVPGGPSPHAERALHPELALLLGAARVLPREFPNLTCRCLDVPPEACRGARAISEALFREAAPDEGGVDVRALRGRNYWRPVLQPVRLASADGASGVPVVDGDHVLITGGLGGVGLALAEDLAERARIRLTLLSRRSIPQRDAWASVAARGGGGDVARQVARLIALEASGTAVRVISADVCDGPGLEGALAAARAASGPIRYAFHAAGVVDDAPLLLKTDEAAARVLAPKVEGTLRLAEALRSHPPERLVLFSSTSAVLGPAGQVDYAAANAFLDAFATSHHVPCPTVSIGWSAWHEVGMTARASGPTVPEEKARFEEEAPHSYPIDHPWLDRWWRASDEHVFEGTLDPERDWVLAEHRVGDGVPVLPGTAYLEIARAGAAEVLGCGATLVLEDVTFVEPWIGETRRLLRLRLEPEGAGYRFSIESTPEDAPGSAPRGRAAPWRCHAEGRVRLLGPGEAGGAWREPIAVPTQGDGLPAHAIPTDGSPAREQPAHERGGASLQQQGGHLRLGPRWNCVEGAVLDGDGGVATLRRVEAAPGEDRLELHPALLDMATGFGLSLAGWGANGGGVYVPVSYGRLRVYRPLPDTFHSRLRLVSVPQGGAVARFEVALFDAHGVIVEVEDLTFKRVAPEAFAAASRGANGDAPPTALDHLIAAGIRVEDGGEALARILATGAVGALAVAPLPLEEVRALLRGSSPVAAVGPADREAQGDTPQDPYEAFLVTEWRDLLGVGAIGVDDDFFRLGGHSLLAVRLFRRIAKAVGCTLELGTLFEAPTIRQLAARVRAGMADAEAGALAPAAEERRIPRRPRRR